jgi:hypothetical protein
MKEDRNPYSWFTTMVDLYRIPTDLPGYQESFRYPDPVLRVKFLEQQLQLDIDHLRLLPYIQLHEFEALLFSDPDCFAIAFPDNPEAIRQSVSVISSHNTSRPCMVRSLPRK